MCKCCKATKDVLLKHFLNTQHIYLSFTILHIIDLRQKPNPSPIINSKKKSKKRKINNAIDEKTKSMAVLELPVDIRSVPDQDLSMAIMCHVEGRVNLLIKSTPTTVTTARFESIQATVLRNAVHGLRLTQHDTLRILSTTNGANEFEN